MKQILVFSIILVFPFVNIFAQTENKYIRKGNAVYSDSKYDKAEVDYQKALNVEPSSYPAAFNLADAVYKQQKFDKAEVQFLQLAKTQTDKTELGQIYHNLANTQLQLAVKNNDMDKVKTAIESYKTALRNNPSDKTTKFNLLYAQKLLEQMQKQQEQNNQDQEQNQDQQQNQNKDKKQQQPDTDNDGIPDKTEKGENEQKPRDSDNDGAPDHNDVDSDNDGIPDSQEAGANPEKPQDTDNDGKPDYRDTDSNNDGKPDSDDAKRMFKISKEDAQRIIDAINKEDKRVQEDVKKAVKANSVKKDKDW